MGVNIPPLTPADMINQMVLAGMIPQGAVSFNPDGTVTVNQNGVVTTYSPTVMPPQGQRGRMMAGMINGVTVRADGSVSFPDGTIYAPVTSMPTPGAGMGSGSMMQ